LGKKVKDVNLSKLKEHSILLAKKVHETEYIPEHVLYVERVGLFPGTEIAKFFGCPISGIAASRSGTSVKSRLKIILRYLPRPITHFLRNLEIKSNMHGIKKERNVYVANRMPPKGKKLLVVDDAIDTGNSLKAVVDFLLEREYEPKNIRKAVLTTTAEKPIYRADISLFESCFAFPWSYDSREYNAAWRRYHQLKDAIN
jgi:hypoxanthine phosphoribosyltransferase